MYTNRIYTNTCTYKYNLQNRKSWLRFPVLQFCANLLSQSIWKICAVVVRTPVHLSLHLLWALIPTKASNMLSKEMVEYKGMASLNSHLCAILHSLADSHLEGSVHLETFTYQAPSWRTQLVVICSFWSKTKTELVRFNPDWSAGVCHQFKQCVWEWASALLILILSSGKWT